MSAQISPEGKPEGKGSGSASFLNNPNPNPSVSFLRTEVEFEKIQTSTSRYVSRMMEAMPGMESEAVLVEKADVESMEKVS